MATSNPSWLEQYRTPTPLSPTGKERKTDIEVSSTAAGIPKTQAETNESVVRTGILEDKRQAALDAKKAAAQQALGQRQQFYSLMQDALPLLQRVRQLSGSTAAGYNALMKDLPETQAKELAAAITQLKAINFKAVTDELKAGNKTGSTGFGRILATEIPLLTNRLAVLDQSRDTHGLVSAADQMENSLRRMYAGANGEGDALYSTDPKLRNAAMMRYGITAPGQVRSAVAPPSALVEEGAPQGLLREGAATTSTSVTPDYQREYEERVQPLFGAPDFSNKYAALRDELDAKYGYEHGDPTQLGIYKKYADTVDKSLKQGASINLKIPPINQAATDFEQWRAGLSTNPIVAGTEGTLAGAVSNFKPFFSTDAANKIEALKEDNPAAATTGSVAGSLLTFGLGSKLGVPASAMYAGQGAMGNYDPDAPLTSLGVGAGEGLLFGKASEGVGKLATGIANVPTTIMSKSGVPLTIGDIAGGYLKPVENALAKVPFAGVMVRARQSDAVKGFNKTAFDAALADINVPSAGIGQQGIEHAQDASHAAFGEVLKDVNVPNSEDFTIAVKNAVDNIKLTNPDHAKALERELSPYISKPDLTGEDFQQILRRSDAIARNAREAGDYGYVSPFTTSVKDAAVQLINDAGLPDVTEGLAAANRTWGKVKMLEKAVAASDNEGGIFTPQTLDNVVKDNIANYQGQAALARGKTMSGEALPLYDLAKEGMTLSVPGKGSAAIPGSALALGAGDIALEAALNSGGDKGGPSATDVGATAARDAAILGSLALGPRALYSKPIQDVLRQRLLYGGEKLTGSEIGQMVQKYLPGALGATAVGGELAAKRAPIRMISVDDGTISQLPLPSESNMPTFVAPDAVNLNAVAPEAADNASADDTENKARGGKVKKKKKKR